MPEMVGSKADWLGWTRLKQVNQIYLLVVPPRVLQITAVTDGPCALDPSVTEKFTAKITQVKA